MDESETNLVKKESFHLRMNFGNIFKEKNDIPLFICLLLENWKAKRKSYEKNNPLKIGINLLSSDNTYGQTVVEVRDKICSIFMMFG